MNLTGKIARENLKDLAKESLSAGPHKIPRTWVVAADKRIARFFRKNGRHLELIGEATPDAVHADFSNKSVGRIVSSGGGTMHHKYGPRMNASHQPALTFTHALADWLDGAVREDAFDRLVLAAAPQTLGDLRKVLSKKVHARIMAEMNKDLTKHDEPALREEMSEFLRF